MPQAQEKPEDREGKIGDIFGEENVGLFVLEF
jgi:hypothetical protein